MRLLILGLLFSFSGINDSSLWWCPGCNLGYPHRTKTCLNKDCQYYKQPKVKK